MRRLAAALLTAGLLIPAACAPESPSALGQRPTSYPAAGQAHDAALAPEGIVDARLLDFASTAAELALTYDHTTYAEDTADAQRLMTPAFAASWGAVAERLRPTTDEKEAHVAATVVGAGLTAATAKRAEVLLFVDRTLRSGGGPDEIGGIAVATLAQRDGQWLLDGLRLTPPRNRMAERRPVPATVSAAATAVADAWADLSSAHPRADVSRMLSLTTGPFRRAYRSAAPELVDRTIASRAVQEGQVISVGIVRLHGRTARVLAAVETALSVGGAAPTRRLTRLDLTLVRTRSAWLARDIRVVPGP